MQIIFHSYVTFIHFIIFPSSFLFFCNEKIKIKEREEPLTDLPVRNPIASPTNCSERPPAPRERRRQHARRRDLPLHKATRAPLGFPIYPPPPGEVSYLSYIPIALVLPPQPNHVRPNMCSIICCHHPSRHTLECRCCWDCINLSQPVVNPTTHVAIEVWFT